MGAEVNYYEVKCKKSELNNEANDLREQCQYDHGHSGYTGTIAEDNGKLTVIETPMTLDDAENYIDENAQKWKSSIAIKIADNENLWLIGGVYSS